MLCSTYTGAVMDTSMSVTAESSSLILTDSLALASLIKIVSVSQGNSEDTMNNKKITIAGVYSYYYLMKKFGNREFSHDEASKYLNGIFKEENAGDLAIEQLINAGLITVNDENGKYKLVNNDSNIIGLFEEIVYLDGLLYNTIVKYYIADKKARSKGYHIEYSDYTEAIFAVLEKLLRDFESDMMTKID